jgi:subtilisin family serine protease
MATIVPTAALAGSGGADRSLDADVVAGSYIVVYNQQAGSVGAATDAREATLGFETTHRYRSALDGFSAELTDDQVNALQSDPAVDFVQADRTVHATDFVPRVAGEPASPTGIRRIVAAKGNLVREKATDNVAVIDTGINLSHPDLNAVNGKDCVDTGTPAEDANGHGTHVSGTIGALNNGSGVTGVAPGTKIYAVRVLNAAGNGTFAQIICGIDWVSANAAAKDIEVANMSLGGTLGGPQSACPGTSDGLHLAICNATDAGTNVTFVVAAGNSGYDYDFPANPDVPAAYKEVLTVSALSDSDGKPGALGPAPSCRTGETDDAPATFSNFAATAAGEKHTIAAPGTCIKSTWLSHGYNVISGTSMASPHMAGVAALCHGEVGSAAGPCKTKTPAQNIAYLRNQAANYNNAHLTYGFLRDPNHSPLPAHYFGFLTRAPNPIP